MGPVNLFLTLLLLPLTLASNISLPLHTSSRWILDATNTRLKLRCVNWAGHMETHLPEGLHKQSIDYLADFIAANGFNCVRLTYSTDHALNPNLRVSDAFAAAAAASGASPDAMNALYQQALVHNPFLATATTQDVFAAVIDKLWARGVMTLLDNHVSKASWCCNLTDGNGWWDVGFGYNTWNSRFFKTNDWLAGLQAMASWARGHPGVVAMSLRNEIREFLLQGSLNGRKDWYDQITAAAKLVHGSNPDVLIVVGGTQSSTDLTHLRTKTLDTSAWAGKHVWEMHAYSFTVNFKDYVDNCDAVRVAYGGFSGFVLEQGQSWTGPLILSEFGVGMTGGPVQNKGLVDQDSKYLDCLVGYMSNNDAEWAVWALQGSYYVRDGKTDYDEGWGILDNEWKGWRNPDFKGLLGNMWKVSQGP
jgi:endoglucanase